MATERTQYPFRQRKSRATTTLDLGDGPRAAPVVRGGNYHVAVQRAPESNLVKLADALSGLSTGAIKLYKSTQQQKEDEMKNLINTLTPEQARLALDGKTEELQESFEKMGVELDEAQRKNLISFSENPQNYIRSSRIAGERIASAYDVQIQQDMKKLVAENPDGDPSEILGSIRDEVIAENELSGYAYEGFMARANATTPTYEATLGKLLDEQKAARLRARTVMTMVNDVKAGNLEKAKEVFRKGTSAVPATEQAEYFSDVVNQLLASDNIAGARKFVASLEEESNNPWTTGNNAPIKEEAIELLGEAIDSWEEAETQKELTIRNRNARNNATRLEQTALKVQNGEEIEEFVLETSKGNMTIAPPPLSKPTAVEFYDHVLNTLDPEVMEQLAPDERLEIETNLIALRSGEATANVQFLSTVGYDAVYSNLSDALMATDDLGNSITGLSEEESEALLGSVTDELRSKLLDLRTDTTIPFDQKKAKADELMREAKRELTSTLAQNPQAEAKAALEEDVLNTFQIGSTTNFKARIMVGVLGQKVDGFPLIETAEERQEMEGKVTEFVDTLRGEVVDIWNRERKESEKTHAEFAANRRDEIEEHIFMERRKFEENIRLASEAEITRDVMISDDPEKKAKMQKQLRRQVALIKEGRQTGPKLVRHESGIGTVRKYMTEKEYLAYKATTGNDVSRLPLTGNKAIPTMAANKWFEMEAAERVLVDGKPAVTIEELKAGNIGGVARINVAEIDLYKTPILSFDMVLNAADNEDTIYEYASVLGIDISDENEVNKFVKDQGALYIKRFGLNVPQEVWDSYQPEEPEEGVKLPKDSPTVTLE